MLKRIEDWNYYELLSVERTASQDEIWEAYQAALATYRDGSLALYGLVREDERELVLERVQEAFQTLRDQDRRREYDLALLRHAPYFPPKAPFRRIGRPFGDRGSPPKRSFWARLKALISPPRRLSSFRNPWTMSSAVSNSPSGPAEVSRKESSESFS
ncbi:MAG: J domain-containing protein [Candidatus Moduliflexus flocculans]|nr:J domain-containing protein [Candidatus Moduliflexus flocculans]